jgi:hypothetical protein
MSNQQQSQLDKLANDLCDEFLRQKQNYNTSYRHSWGIKEDETKNIVVAVFFIDKSINDGHNPNVKATALPARQGINTEPAKTCPCCQGKGVVKA